MSGREIKGTVHAVCLSETKGVQKTPCEEVTLVVGHGLEGDAHAGKWHRQVSLLSKKSIKFMKDRGADVDRGSFGENIVVEGIEVHELPVGTTLRIGEKVLLKVTQIGKECHTMCAIGKAVGDCIMPRRGIFCEVIVGGKVRPGQTIEVVDEP